MPCWMSCSPAVGRKPAEKSTPQGCFFGRPRSSPGSCGSSGPRMESTVTRTICGTRALNPWLHRLSSSPAASAAALRSSSSETGIQQTTWSPVGVVVTNVLNP